MINHLFVYGTLAPGQPNEHVLSCMQGSWQKASVIGTLLHKGWGAATGYPGIILDPHGSKVDGLVFSSIELPKNWQRLDDFEGDGYQRVLTPVELEGGMQLTAYIYQLSEKSLPDNC